MTDAAITIQGHVLRVVHATTGWCVRLDRVTIGYGATYDEAVGEAVTALEAITAALQGPPWVPTPRARKTRA